MRYSNASRLATALLAASVDARFVMYADEWHPTRPTNPADRAGIDHVILAFAMANATAAFQPKVPITTIRSEFPNAKVCIAVGGWGDDTGFMDASKTPESIQKFANDIATMLTNTGADGVDIDWEYPGGNGADYKVVPNSAKAYQIDAFPEVLKAIRGAIGDKILSIAVPGKDIDMIGYTEETGPKIWPSVDQINVMAYDLMNRRDNITNHHASVEGAKKTVENYINIGAPPEKMNLGFPFYAKYFTTQGDCGQQALGCPIVLAEDPVTGKDTLTSGAWTFEPAHMKPVDSSSLTVSYDGTCGPDKGTKCATGCCSQYGNCGTSPEHCSGACQHAFGTGCTDSDVAGSWQKAATNGVTDEDQGGQYYFDPENKIFWTWDTPELITRKFNEIMSIYKLGGAMAWSLGEDSYDYSHIHQIAAELGKLGDGGYSPSPAAPPYAAKPSPKPSYAATSPKKASPYAWAPSSSESEYAAATPDVYAPSHGPVGKHYDELSRPQMAKMPMGGMDMSDMDMSDHDMSDMNMDASPPAPLAPAPAPPVAPAPDAYQPQTDSSSSLSSPYDVVWVDGSKDGPQADYSSNPGSPDDYVDDSYTDEPPAVAKSHADDATWAIPINPELAGLPAGRRSRKFRRAEERLAVKNEEEDGVAWFMRRHM